SAAGSRKPSKIAAPSSAGVRNGMPAARSYSRNQMATAVAPARPTTSPSPMIVRLMMVSCLGHAAWIERAREPSMVRHVAAALVHARLAVEEARHVPTVALSDALHGAFVACELNLALRKEEYTMKGRFMIVGLVLIILGVI